MLHVTKGGVKMTPPRVASFHVIDFSNRISANMSEANNDRFNAEAAAWDSNPDIHLASSLALKAIQTHIPALQSLNVLEIGCGTGVLSLLIAPHVRSLTAVDVAEGMISALKLKLAKPDAPQNILPVYAMLEDPDDERIRPDPLSKEVGRPRRFDLVISHLVLHHIPALPEVLTTMYGCLKSGGGVALTDFEDFGPEARKFHPEAKMTGVERHGISRKAMKGLLSDAGFVDVKVETAFEMEKDIEVKPGEGVVKGHKMTFPFLICTGKKA